MSPIGKLAQRSQNPFWKLFWISLSGGGAGILDPRAFQQTDEDETAGELEVVGTKVVVGTLKLVSKVLLVWITLDVFSIVPDDV